MPNPTEASPTQNPIAVIGKIAGFAAVMFIGTFVAQFGALIVKVITRVSDIIWLPLILFGVVLLVSKLFLNVLERQPLRALGIGFDRPWLRQTFMGLVLGAIMVALCWCGLVAAGATWSMNADLASNLKGLILAGIFAAGIGAYEETLCRGYAMQVLYRWKPAVGIIVPGLYFVAVHLPHSGGTAPLAILNMFLAHLLYVICFLRTRSLWLGIGIHIAWNFSLAFVFGMPISGQRTPATIMRTELPHSLLLGNEFGPEAGLIVTMVLGLGAILLWKLLPARRPLPSLIDSSGVVVASTAARPIEGSPIPPAHALGPQESRFRALDILRAVAVFGILPMNIQGFALHDSAVLNPYACAWTDSFNVAVWVVTTALFGRKDLMLFAMLFGAGIVMVTDRATAAGRSALQMHLQRMGALVLIALVHAYLIWSGDILFTYAVCGTIVFACRKWTPKNLFLMGSALFLLPMCALVAAQLALPLFSPETQTSLLAVFNPSAETIQQHYETYRGSWLAQMPARVDAALAQHTALLLIAMGWVSSGMMLIGMGLYRLGYLSGQCTQQAYVRLLGWTASLGLLLTTFGFWINFERGWRAEFSFLIGRLPGELGAPLLALATVAAIMLIFARREKNWLAASLSAVGQMSLTNYLMHSVILTFLFYGTGLGWIGTVDRAQQMMIVVSIWLLQMAYSPLWLRYFLFGPVEWLWRSLAYYHWQPMRRSSRSSAAVPTARISKLEG